LIFSSVRRIQYVVAEWARGTAKAGNRHEMMKVRFGEFTLDPAGQELLRAGEPVHLTPKVMRLLELLIENRGRLVQLREIYDRLWPDVVVSDVNVRNSVAVLRAALDDHERDGRFIRSIHNRGYMFRGEMIEVSEESRAAGGSIRHGDDSFRLRDGRNIVGRDDDCWLRLADPTVSRHHAAIVVSAPLDRPARPRQQERDVRRWNPDHGAVRSVARTHPRVRAGRNSLHDRHRGSIDEDDIAREVIPLPSGLIPLSHRLRPVRACAPRAVV
jgi:DNA-binding winged helix-turn-helix (wHTH) protein